MIFSGIIIQYHATESTPQKNPQNRNKSHDSECSHHSLHGHVSVSAWFKDDLRLFRTFRQIARGVASRSGMYGWVYPSEKN